MSVKVELTSIYDADILDGHEFEYWCAALLQCNGFTDVSVTRGSGDQGVDVLARKDNKKYAIQCKRFYSNVNNKAVQEVYAGRLHYGCDVAAVMTNRYFTQGAIDLAKSAGVELWDRNQLIYWLDIANGKNALSSDFNRRVRVRNASAPSKRGKQDLFRRRKNSYISHPVRFAFLSLLAITAIMIGAATGSTSDNEAEKSHSNSGKTSISITSEQEAPYVKCNGVSANMQSIEANTFDYIGYDEVNQVLIVRIPKYRSFFLYYEFPSAKFDAFIDSDNPDVYFNNSIGGQYETVKIPENEAESTVPEAQMSSASNKKTA